MSSKTEAALTSNIEENNVPLTTNLLEENLLSKITKLEWLGQTVASLSWVSSMFFYGLSSTGDWLQLIAGMAWFIANLASLSDK